MGDPFPFSRRCDRSRCFFVGLLWFVGSQFNGVDGYECAADENDFRRYACTRIQSQCTDPNQPFYCCENGPGTKVGTCQHMCDGTAEACTCASKLGGTCGNTDAELCDGGSAAWRSGYCPGAANIQCCAGDRSAKPGEGEHIA